jgi:ribosomal protein S18 acetylase RimI-like enzyme
MPLVLEPHWVGRRVVLRRALDRDPSGKIMFSDVVGDLIELDDDRAVLATKDGPVEVPRAHIAIAKRPEPSTADILALERVSGQGWRAGEVSELGGWTLRADHGITGRANSVLPGRQLDRPLEQALAEAGEWYAARGLPTTIKVPLPGRHILDNALTELGWDSTSDTHVLAARLDVVIAAADLAATGRDAWSVDLADQPDEDWLAAQRDANLRTDAGRALLTRHDRARFATVRSGGSVLATGRGAVDNGWLGITSVEVADSHRRQRLATDLLRALWRWALADEAATYSYLQVSAENDPALTLYRGLGYWPHHDYRYRSSRANTA